MNKKKSAEQLIAACKKRHDTVVNNCGNRLEQSQRKLTKTIEKHYPVKLLFWAKVPSVFFIELYQVAKHQGYPESIKARRVKTDELVDLNIPLLILQKRIEPY